MAGVWQLWSLSILGGKPRRVSVSESCLLPRPQLPVTVGELGAAEGTLLNLTLFLHLLEDALVSTAPNSSFWIHMHYLWAKEILSQLLLDH